MLLKPGELAKRSGLTIRTLHYYHQIGLLVPSARSAAGYRLYSRDDISRLHRIQALRRLGVALAEIAAVLDQPSSALMPLIAQQLTLLDRQQAEIARLRGQLQRLHQQLQAGQDPELNDWLATLELMTMYDNYFTADELQQLPLYQADPAREAQWREAVAAATAMIAAGTPPEAPDAQQLARRWMQMLERDTGGNPAFVARLNAMHRERPEMREQSGITPALTAFITRAFAETKLQIYQRYLDEQEYAYVRAHYFDRIDEWPQLIGRCKAAMEQGVAADTAEARALASHWLALFRSWAGDNPQTQQKIRDAMQQEPTLLEGTWLTPPLLGWLRAALLHLMSTTATGAAAMQPQIRQLPALQLAAFRLQGPWAETTPQGFARLGAWLAQHPLAGDWLAVYHGDPQSDAAEQLQVDTGISVAADFVLPAGSEGVSLRQIPAGQYAVAEVAVSDGDFARPWLDFFTQWLPASGYQRAAGPCFDRYLNDGSADGVWRFLICVPVVKRG